MSTTIVGRSPYDTYVLLNDLKEQASGSQQSDRQVQSAPLPSAPETAARVQQMMAAKEETSQMKPVFIPPLEDLILNELTEAWLPSFKKLAYGDKLPTVPAGKTIKTSAAAVKEISTRESQLSQSIKDKNTESSAETAGVILRSLCEYNEEPLDSSAADLFFSLTRKGTITKENQLEAVYKQYKKVKQTQEFPKINELFNILVDSEISMDEVLKQLENFSQKHRGFPPITQGKIDEIMQQRTINTIRKHTNTGSLIPDIKIPETYSLSGVSEQFITLARRNPAPLLKKFINLKEHNQKLYNIWKFHETFDITESFATNSELLSILIRLGVDPQHARLQINTYFPSKKKLTEDDLAAVLKETMLNMLSKAWLPSFQDIFGNISYGQQLRSLCEFNKESRFSAEDLLPRLTSKGTITKKNQLEDVFHQYKLVELTQLFPQSDELFKILVDSGLSKEEALKQLENFRQNHKELKLYPFKEEHIENIGEQTKRILQQRKDIRMKDVPPDQVIQSDLSDQARKKSKKTKVSDEHKMALIAEILKSKDDGESAELVIAKIFENKLGFKKKEPERISEIAMWILSNLYELGLFGYDVDDESNKKIIKLMNCVKIDDHWTYIYKKFSAATSLTLFGAMVSSRHARLKPWAEQFKNDKRFKPAEKEFRLLKIKNIVFQGELDYQGF